MEKTEEVDERTKVRADAVEELSNSGTLSEETAERVLQTFDPLAS